MNNNKDDHRTRINYIKETVTPTQKLTIKIIHPHCRIPEDFKDSCNSYLSTIFTQIEIIRKKKKPNKVSTLLIDINLWKLWRLLKNELFSHEGKFVGTRVVLINPAEFRSHLVKHDPKEKMNWKKCVDQKLINHSMKNPRVSMIVGEWIVYPFHRL